MCGVVQWVVLDGSGSVVNEVGWVVGGEEAARWLSMSAWWLVVVVVVVGAVTELVCVLAIGA